MTIKAIKPALNIREELNELKFDKVPLGKMPAGSVLQVVIVEDATSQALSTSTYTDTGLSVSITPSSTSSRILCMWNMQASLAWAHSGFGVQLVRDATNIFTSAVPYHSYSIDAGNRQAADFKHLDSPTTISEITYKIQVSSQAGFSIDLNNGGNQTQLVLMEIGG